MGKIKQVIRFGIVCGIILISLLTFNSCSNKIDSIDIEVSTSGCHKTCPVIDVKIEGDKVLFNLLKYNDKIGFFKYTLTKDEMRKINNLLSIVEIETLKDEYVSNRVDMQVYSVYIFKNSNKKEVYYYENEAPVELEKLIDEIIKLKDREITECKEGFISFTREKVPLYNIPIPPLPDI